MAAPNSPIDLFQLCRVCLYRYDDMLDLLGGQEQEAKTRVLFNAVANFEVEQIENYPFFLCKWCEQKLNQSYEFREQCRKSNDLIKNHIFNRNKIKTEELLAQNFIDCGTENSSELVAGFSQDSEMKEEDELGGEDSLPNFKVEVDSEEEEDDSEMTEQGKLRLSSRLEQYPFAEVSKAIDDTKKNFLENTTCSQCGFTASNSRTLSAHMTHTHSDVINQKSPNVGLVSGWCAYFGCTNARRTDKNVSYFKFPIKDRDRCNQWVINSGNVNLIPLDISDLKYTILCEKHFEKSSYRFSNKRKMLNHNVVPIPYSPM